MKINLDTIADFTWGFSFLFLLEVKNPKGKSDYYQWSSPGYPGGDNTIEPYTGDPRNFTMLGFCGRAKGTRRIRDYCGSEVKFVNCD